MPRELNSRVEGKNMTKKQLETLEAALLVVASLTTDIINDKENDQLLRDMTGSYQEYRFLREGMIDAGNLWLTLTELLK